MKTNKKNSVSENNMKNTAKEVISKFAENTKGVLKTSLGTKKTSIYKEEIFANCTEKEKKSLRKKFRNMIFSVSKALKDETNKENKTKLINAFNELYSEVYKVNDYSLQSVCSENLSNEKKEILQNALNICKK